MDDQISQKLFRVNSISSVTTLEKHRYPIPLSLKLSLFLYIYIYIYIYMYMCVCVCVCVCIIGRCTKRFVFFKFIYFVLTYMLYMCMFPACCFRQRKNMAQSLLNGIINETWTLSCSQFKCFSVGNGFYIEF